MPKLAAVRVVGAGEVIPVFYGSKKFGEMKTRVFSIPSHLSPGYIQCADAKDMVLSVYCNSMLGSFQVTMVFIVN